MHLLVGLLTILLLGFPVADASPDRFTVSGYVEDAETGERLIGASVYEPTHQIGTTTNNYGFFSLTLPAGPATLRISFVGYETEQLELTLSENVRQTIRLRPRTAEIDEVTVTASQPAQPGISRVQLAPAQIQTVPALLGETDLLKVFQLMPGVQSGNEGFAGLYVRGGGPDQNLILLDGAPVYNPAHLFGFLSVFNTSAIQNVELIKGGFPARYGERLSSVLDITTREGNLHEMTGSAGVGLIASRLTLEGPIVAGRSSFSVSGRRTYADVLARPWLHTDDRRTGYYFYDLNAKANHIFSDRSRLYVSMYGGRDRFYFHSEEELASADFEEAAELSWGNVILTARWTQLIGHNLFSRVTLLHSRYDFATDASDTRHGPGGASATRLRYDSGLHDWRLSWDLDYAASPHHAIKMGATVNRHAFRPGEMQVTETRDGQIETDRTVAPSETIRATELAVYGEDEMRLSTTLVANVGLRASGFIVEDTFYGTVQPRLSASVGLPAGWRVNASISNMQQYVHLLAHAGVGLPTDLWVPATARIGPQNAWQGTLGVEWRFGGDTYEIGLEGYYKAMDGLIEYREGAAVVGLEQDWQESVATGQGRSYGVEVLLRKHRGRATGWIGYTLSWTQRQFDELNDGAWFPYRFDRRHDLSLVLSRRLTERRTISATWVYGTGNAVSLPVARYLSGPAWGTMDPGLIQPIAREIEHYGPRNSMRMRAYHRLDLSYRIRYDHGWGEGELSLGLYNVYNRKNPFFMFLERTYDPQTQTNRDAIKQVSLFPTLPAASYSISF